MTTEKIDKEEKAGGYRGNYSYQGLRIGVFDGEYGKSYAINKSYKSGDEYKQTSFFNASDLPALKTLLEAIIEKDEIKASDKVTFWLPKDEQ